MFFLIPGYLFFFWVWEVSVISLNQLSVPLSSFVVLTALLMLSQILSPFFIPFLSELSLESIVMLHVSSGVHLLGMALSC